MTGGSVCDLEHAPKTTEEDPPQASVACRSGCEKRVAGSGGVSRSHPRRPASSQAPKFSRNLIVLGDRGGQRCNSLPASVDVDGGNLSSQLIAVCAGGCARRVSIWPDSNPRLGRRSTARREEHTCELAAASDEGGLAVVTSHRPPHPPPRTGEFTRSEQHVLSRQLHVVARWLDQNARPCGRRVIAQPPLCRWFGAFLIPQFGLLPHRHAAEVI